MQIPIKDLLYMTCDACSDEVPEGENIRDYGRISVSVTPVGDLVIACERHMSVVAYILNENIAEGLRGLVGIGCDHCDGHSHKKKETLH